MRNSRPAGGDVINLGEGQSLLYTTKASADTPDDNFRDATDQSGPVNGLDSKWTVVAGDAATVPLSMPAAAGTNDYDTSTAGRMRMAIGGGAGAGLNDEIKLRQDWTLPENTSIVGAFELGLLTNGDNLSRDYQELRLGISLNTSELDSVAGEFLTCGWVTEGADLGQGASFNGAATPWQISSQAGGWEGLSYFRIQRLAGLDYVAHVALNEGGTWHQTSFTETPTVAYSNLWLEFDPATNASGAAAQGTCYWIRQGTNDYDPWPF